MIFFLILLLPLLCFGENAWKDEKLQLFALWEVSDNSVSLNEPLNLTITLEYPLSFTTDSNFIRQSLLKTLLPISPFQIIDTKEISNKLESRQKKVLSFTLEPILLGEQMLSFEVPFFEQEKLITKFSSGPIMIRVLEVQRDPNFQFLLAPLFDLSNPNAIEISAENRQNYELKDRSTKILEAFRSHLFPWKKVFLALFLLTLLPIAIILLKNQPPPSKEELREEAKRRTQRLLERLKSKMGRKESEIKLYTELSQVMRMYIKDRFGISAPFLTTEEFLSYAASSHFLDNESQERLKTFLIKADLIKFGHKISSKTEFKESFQLVKQFVDKS